MMKKETPMLSETLFDTFVHAFTLKPLLIAGKAMAYYELYDGQNYEFVLAKQEFLSLQTTGQYDLFTTPFGDAGIRAGGYTFYEGQFGFSYFHLERDAVDRQDYLVAHPASLFFLSVMRLVQEPTVQEAQVDMLLLMYKMGVLEADASEPPSASDEALPALSQQVPIEEVQLTRLERSVATVLKDHGCLIHAGTWGLYRVRFPASTRSTPFSPIGPIKRFRVVLPDGVDLRYDYNLSRTMSILYLADPEAHKVRKAAETQEGTAVQPEEGTEKTS